MDVAFHRRLLTQGNGREALAASYAALLQPVPAELSSAEINTLRGGLAGRLRAEFLANPDLGQDSPSASKSDIYHQAMAQVALGLHVVNHGPETYLDLLEQALVNIEFLNNKSKDGRIFISPLLSSKSRPSVLEEAGLSVIQAKKALKIQAAHLSKIGVEVNLEDMSLKVKARPFLRFLQNLSSSNDSELGLRRTQILNSLASNITDNVEEIYKAIAAHGSHTSFIAEESRGLNHHLSFWRVLFDEFGVDTSRLQGVIRAVNNDYFPEYLLLKPLLNDSHSVHNISSFHQTLPVTKYAKKIDRILERLDTASINPFASFVLKDALNNQLKLVRVAIADMEEKADKDRTIQPFLSLADKLEKQLLKRIFDHIHGFN